MAIYKSYHGQLSHSLVTVKKFVWEGTLQFYEHAFCTALVEGGISGEMLPDTYYYQTLYNNFLSPWYYLQSCSRCGAFQLSFQHGFLSQVCGLISQAHSRPQTTRNIRTDSIKM